MAFVKSGSPCKAVDKIHGCSWWVDSVQQYYGKAPHLPADGHFVTALIAPRRFVIGAVLDMSLFLKILLLSFFSFSSESEGFDVRWKLLGFTLVGWCLKLAYVCGNS
jgi:hypothetical protein